MKLTVLADNNTYIDRYCLGEPAVSYYIEDNEKKLLFDTGYSDVFLQNAATFQIDLSTLSTIVISHGHNDHTRGLKFLQERNLLADLAIIAHPDAFEERYDEGMSIGAPLAASALRDTCQLTLSKNPVRVSDHLMFLGEIPSIIPFEERHAIGWRKERCETMPDFVMDDSALAFDSGEGLFIITGCSHSGICNIVEHAKKVCDETRILGILGGFHLFSLSPQLTQTINYFEKNNIKALYPCHCTSFAVKAEIHKRIPIHEVGVGMELIV